MRVLVFVLALGLGAPPSRGAATGSRDSLETLAWMAGSWASDSSGIRVEEHWTSPRGGLMVGMHRDVVRDRAVSFEFLRIVSDSAGIAYLANPQGRPATRFPLAERGERRVVFANPEHDFPQRIAYWLDAAGALHARVEGTLGGQPASAEWRWKPGRLSP